MSLLETHVYTGLKILKSKNPYFIVGLGLPDLVEVTDYIKEEETHNRGQEFFNWVKANGYKKLLPLAAGFLVHEKTDYAAEKNHNGLGKGFVFINPHFNIERIVRSMGSKAHSFPEVKMDALVAYQNPGLRNLIKSSFKQVDLGVIITCLADFYDKDKKKMRSVIQRYVENAKLYVDWLMFVKYASPLVPYNKMYKKQLNEFIENALDELKSIKI